MQLIKHMQQDRYILMVLWDQIENHTEGFRKSSAYQEWKALLQPFYEPMPTVEYYQPCMLMKKKEASAAYSAF